MNISIIIVFLILIYLFPQPIHQLYTYVFGKILIYLMLILIAYQDNISGILLIGILICNKIPVEASK